MSSHRTTSRAAGLWFIATFAFSIPALLLYAPVLDHADYVLGGGADNRIAAGAALEVLLAIANIATAVVLYPVVRRQSQSVALGYVTLRVIETGVILVGVLGLLSVLTLRQDVGGAGAADAGSLTVAGRSLVAIHDWSFLIGPQLCAGFGTGLLLGSLMYRSGLVPRRMALVGLIGGPLAFLAGFPVLFGVYDQPSLPLFALTALEIFWEVFLGIYLTWKGFRPSPILGDEVAMRVDALPAPAAA